MVAFILRRALLAIPTLIFISFISFVIIQLPPGDYVSAYAAELRRISPPSRKRPCASNWV
jgi:peptide/nickel transport system permease protein